MGCSNSIITPLGTTHISQQISQESNQNINASHFIKRQESQILISPPLLPSMNLSSLENIPEGNISTAYCTKNTIPLNRVKTKILNKFKVTFVSTQYLTV